MSTLLYCIQDTRSYVGNAVIWWRVSGNGYTCHVDEAWIVGEEEAKHIEASRGTDKAWPIEKIEAAMSLHVDAQRLR